MAGICVKKLSRDYIQGLEDSAEVILSVLFSVATLEEAKDQVKEIVGATQGLKIEVIRSLLMT